MAAATLPLLDRHPITYSSALDYDDNYINQAAYAELATALYWQLWGQRDAMAAVTRHHLNLVCDHAVRIARPAQWIRGSFNICIPVEVGPSAAATKEQRLLLRCPMPFKLAESKYPGTVDEKMGCEVGAYIWMQDHCPDINIPHLYGFGFSGLRQVVQFTHVSHRPFYVRAVHWLRRIISHLCGRQLSNYVPHPAPPACGLSTPYLLLEYINPEVGGQMLSKTWDKHRQQSPERRQRLFRGLAHIMLSLARMPQPRIGSFQFHDNGAVSLTNRPLTTTLAILENDGTPRTIGQYNTFDHADTFASGMLSFHDERFRTHPNAVYDADDARVNMAARVILRALLHRYITRDGPFLLQFTDLHASNIFVDPDWNITYLIDLEWICALPATMLNVPSWLTGESIDGLVGDKLAEFDAMRLEFMQEFEQAERDAGAHRHGVVLSDVMRGAWDRGVFWFWYCLRSVNGIKPLVDQHFCSGNLLFDAGTKAISRYWCDDPEKEVERKVQQHSQYCDELERLYKKGSQLHVDSIPPPPVPT